MRRLVLMLMVGLFYSTTTVLAQYNVSGYVKDSQTGKALPGVTVQAVGVNQTATTDANGYYELSGLRVGKYIIEYMLSG